MLEGAPSENSWSGFRFVGHAMAALRQISTGKSLPLVTRLDARVLRHDAGYGLSTLHFADGELRAPLVEAPVGAGLRVKIDARDVSIALSRPMDVSILNRLPGSIVDLTPLRLPYVRVAVSLGTTEIYALVTAESVDRLALEEGLRVWAMLKSLAISEERLPPSRVPAPRRWRVVGSSD
jgi:molybdate transport system ATP-binding protein